MRTGKLTGAKPSRDGATLRSGELTHAKPKPPLAVKLWKANDPQGIVNHEIINSVELP